MIENGEVHNYKSPKGRGRKGGKQSDKICGQLHHLSDEIISGDEIRLHGEAFFTLSSRCNMFSIEFQ